VEKVSFLCEQQQEEARKEDRKTFPVTCCSFDNKISSLSFGVLLASSRAPFY